MKCRHTMQYYRKLMDELHLTPSDLKNYLHTHYGKSFSGWSAWDVYGWMREQGLSSDDVRYICKGVE